MIRITATVLVNIVYSNYCWGYCGVHILLCVCVCVYSVELWAECWKCVL